MSEFARTLRRIRVSLTPVWRAEDRAADRAHKHRHRDEHRAYRDYATEHPDATDAEIRVGLGWAEAAFTSS